MKANAGFGFPRLCCLRSELSQDQLSVRSFELTFAGFEVFNRLFASWKGTSWELSPGLANFLAGGLASNMYWFAALPMDNIKNRIMADSPTKPKYPSVLGAYRTVWRETYDPSRGLGWNSLARLKNFYKVSSLGWVGGVGRGVWGVSGPW